MMRSGSRGRGKQMIVAVVVIALLFGWGWGPDPAPDADGFLTSLPNNFPATFSTQGFVDLTTEYSQAQGANRPRRSSPSPRGSSARAAHAAVPKRCRS